MAKRKVLIQLDSDPHASTFDAIVAVDAGVEHLLQYHSVEPTLVRELVHGAMFTRGPSDLHSTAIFIGGANVSAGETLLAQVRDCFFGPMRVSVMLDANGANTTAAAAVLAAARHTSFEDCSALVLGATGPVGQRAVRLLAQQGVAVRVGSRRRERAEQICEALRERLPQATLDPVQTFSAAETAQALEDVEVLIAAGAIGAELVDVETRRGASSLRVAIDLNAIPPTGLAGVEPTAKAEEQDGAICYGAIGVGETKMKIHKAALRKLFEANDQVFDAEEIFALGQSLEDASTR